MQPPSQRYRRIGFNLTGGQGEDARFDFVVRPEDLTRTEPSRMSVNNTLGGAWVDAFGAGVGNITISGHNGWRGGFLQSGEDLFQALRSTCFEGWHKRRADAIEAGTDPSEVELVFIDTLDRITVSVAPESFTLRRSRTRPLLIQYQMRLIELGDGSGQLTIFDEIVDALTNPLRFLAGVTGLGNLLSTAGTYFTAGMAVFGALKGAATQFFGTVIGVITAARDVAEEARGVFDATTAPIYATALALSSAAASVFNAFAADDTLPASQRIPVMALAADMTDAYCTLNNSFNPGRYFRSFDDLFGASNCSSTGGGEAASSFLLAGTNPFESIHAGTASSAISVTPDAAAAIVSLRRDPLSLVGDTATLGRAMTTIADGVDLA